MSFNFKSEVSKAIKNVVDKIRLTPGEEERSRPRATEKRKEGGRGSGKPGPDLRSARSEKSAKSHRGDRGGKTEAPDEPGKRPGGGHLKPHQRRPSVDLPGPPSPEPSQGSQTVSGTPTASPPVQKQNPSPPLEYKEVWPALNSAPRDEALLAYIRTGHAEEAIGVLDDGADPNAVTKWGVSALHLTCADTRNGTCYEDVGPKTTAIAAALIAKGANVSAKDRRGATPLHKAIRLYDLEKVKLFLGSKACLDVTDNEGNTPLHVAAGLRGSAGPDIVKALLGANGAKQLGTKNKKGLTPIDIATGWKGDKSIADLLVEAPKQDLLFDACKSGDLDGVLKLLEDGADPNLAKSGTGATPVHVATMWKQYHLIGPLCERGADLGKQDKAGRTPLHVAAHNQDAEMIKLLLKLGANPKLITKTGVTAREMAARSGRSDLVELFAKAEKSAETESRVPVEDAWVSVEDQVEIEQVTRFDAADGGRKAEPRDNYQRTALMRAVCVEWDEKKVVELLQRTGEDKVDIEARDIWGNTPLIAACNSGVYSGIVRALLSGGADRSATDSEGRTAVEVARMRGWTDIVALFEQ